MRATFFGTTTLLFDDGKDQILFDAHFTRPSLARYLFGRGVTDAALVDELLFRGGETFAVGGFSVTVLPSRHSKPTPLNNDLGMTIDAPLVQPARLRAYREGGSFDFLAVSGEKRILIRPSFNFIEGQLDGVRADVIYLGIAGLAKADRETEARFFAETVEKVGAKLVIPLHWDNFFSRLDRPVRGMPRFVEKTEVALYRLARYCEARGVDCAVQWPRTSMRL